MFLENRTRYVSNLRSTFQFLKIVELEDRVMSQEHTIASLLEKLNAAEADKRMMAELAGRLVKLESENLR